MKKSNFAFWLALNPLVDVYKLLAIFWQKSSEYSNALSLQKLFANFKLNNLHWKLQILVLLSILMKRFLKVEQQFKNDWLNIDLNLQISKLINVGHF